MNDFFDRYKKKKTLHHLGIFWLAFVLAAWVHMTLFSGNSGEYITASIIDVVGQEQEVQKSDVYSEFTDGTLIIRNSQDMVWLESVSFTIAYNPEIWTLDTDQLGGLEVEVLAEENEPWLLYVQLSLPEAQDLIANSLIARIPYTLEAEWRQFFNIIQASFTDSDGEIYLLSSSWTQN